MEKIVPTETFTSMFEEPARRRRNAAQASVEEGRRRRHSECFASRERLEDAKAATHHRGGP